MPAKQIVRDEEARHALMHGINIVANAVRVTLGPKGHNVVLERKWGAPIVTNDGCPSPRKWTFTSLSRTWAPS